MPWPVSDDMSLMWCAWALLGPFRIRIFKLAFRSSFQLKIHRPSSQSGVSSQAMQHPTLMMASFEKTGLWPDVLAIVNKFVFATPTALILKDVNVDEVKVAMVPDLIDPDSESESIFDRSTLRTMQRMRERRERDLVIRIMFQIHNQFALFQNGGNFELAAHSPDEQ